VLLICLAVACGFMGFLKDMAANKFRKNKNFSGGKSVIYFLVY